MSKINLIRADFRLIHGQVVTKWLKESNANRIIIINDVLAKDDFMGDVYKTAVPNGIKVDIYTIDDAIKNWQLNKFGDDTILMLFKEISDAYQFQKKGFFIETLQIGGLGGGPGRTKTPCGVTFDAKDVKLLSEMEAQNSRIYIQAVPTDNKIPFKKAIEHCNFN
ncbi:PTS sugar transporter [Gilliamella sp. wkB178]|uniref:PTS system mannose/fructose/N-acetylgalactosamine-transporter subunit IIB n=1 Tax=Gilliamella sp. wkB178 TaxID=3120259 RepID=UPI00080D92C3|nr:PTS sugar transporter subunit IIB [Gilliamella apicola]OCG08790.1 PTS sugar transporter [Gilliamella apicola]